MDIIETRASEYGDIRPNHERIAALWSAHLGATVTAFDVAIMMTLVKLSRLKAARGHHDDSWVDAHAYLNIAERLK